jgi:hypothetical protein
MEYLLKYLEGLKRTVSKKNARLWECVNNSWTKLNNYYRMIDNYHNIYAAAILLYSTMRLARFKRNWIEVLESWI